ncbi:hypothetical protein FB45DRAFT_724323, partial [Roridomyces roridus]
ELCKVPRGQLMRKQVSAEKTKDVLDFATKKLADRFNSIIAGIHVLGMHADHAAGPLNVQARILTPPRLKYGARSRQLTITPRDGAWTV